MEYPDNFSTYAFLSSEAYAQRASLHPAFADSMGAAREVVRQALAELPRSRAYTAQRGSAAALAFWLRTLESCQATILLLDLGMPGAAAAAVRTAYECLFHCCALLIDPSFYSRLNAAHVHEYKLQAKQLKSLKDVNLSEEMLQKLEEYASDEPEGKKWSTFEVAMAAGLQPLYESVWRGMASLGAHATERSLDRHFVTRADGEEQMTYAPDFRSLEVILMPVIFCLQVGRDRLREHINPAAIEPSSQE